MVFPLHFEAAYPNANTSLSDYGRRASRGLEPYDVRCTEKEVDFLPAYLDECKRGCPSLFPFFPPPFPSYYWCGFPLSSEPDFFFPSEFTSGSFIRCGRAQQHHPPSKHSFLPPFFRILSFGPLCASPLLLTRNGYYPFFFYSSNSILGLNLQGVLFPPPLPFPFSLLSAFVLLQPLFLGPRLPLPSVVDLLPPFRYFGLGTPPFFNSFLPTLFGWLLPVPQLCCPQLVGPRLFLPNPSGPFLL